MHYLAPDLQLGSLFNIHIPTWQTNSGFPLRMIANREIAR